MDSQIHINKRLQELKQKIDTAEDLIGGDKLIAQVLWEIAFQMNKFNMRNMELDYINKKGD